MTPDEFRALKGQLEQMNAGGLLGMIHREEEINRKLASLGKPE